MIHSTISKIIVQQEILYDELVKQDQIQNVKFQNILYFMNSVKGYVNNTPVDFLQAMSKMESLDYKFDDNLIGFVNKKTNSKSFRGSNPILRT